MWAAIVDFILKMFRGYQVDPQLKYFLDRWTGIKQVKRSDFTYGILYFSWVSYDASQATNICSNGNNRLHTSIITQDILKGYYIYCTYVYKNSTYCYKVKYPYLVGDN